MDELDLIKEKINVVDLIQEYIPVKKAGVNYKANCPFHNEKSPSFVISPERGIWKCFGCGKGGDIFKFIVEKEGVEFGEAVEILAKRAGITLQRKKSAKSNTRDRLFEANAKASEFFHFLLTEHKLGKPALEYLQKRGLTDETIKLFQLGYAPNSWQSLAHFLTKRGFTRKELVDAGLLIESRSNGYDRFRGRIMYPFVDVKGQYMGMSGRVLGKGEPKYLNTPQTQVFDKGNSLFGLNLTKADIRSKKMAIIVEGEMDMIMSYQSGVKNIVASKGTALTTGQIELIKKYTETVALCFDKDLAGDAAARRGIEMADQAGLQIKIIQIPDGKDPADTCQKDPELWKEAVQNAQSIYDYYLESSQKRFNPKTAEGKRAIGRELMPIWAKITDPMTSEHYIQKLAALLSVDDKFLKVEIKKSTQQGAPTYKTVAQQPVAPGRPAIGAFRSRQELLEEYLMSLLLRIPAGVTFVPKFPETIFLSENLRSLYVLLVVYLDAISFQGKAFKISNFIKTVPPDLIEKVDQLYLIEIDDKLGNSKAWQEEVEKVIKELKKALVKASLEKLSAEIKTAQTFGNMELLETLNKRFRDLSLKLKNL